MPQLPKSGPQKQLKRYTHLPALIQMLRSKSLTLLDPSTWDDSNDTFYLSEYKRRNNLKSVLAVCLSEADESYHLWKIFAGHPSGVCIRLRQGILFKTLKANPNIVIAAINYQKMTSARKKELTVAEFPFVKRDGYLDEREVRVIWKSSNQELSNLEIPIPISCIARITLSPWLPKSLVESTKNMLHEIEGCSHIQITRSTIIASEEWKNIAKKAP